MRMYHGTKGMFSVFRASKIGKYGPGIYLSGSPLEASGYATGVHRNSPVEGSGGSVMPLYVRMVNPLTLLMQPDGSYQLMTRSGALSPAHEKLAEKLVTVRSAVETTSSQDFTLQVRDMGHDGVIVDISGAIDPTNLQGLDPDTVIEDLLQQVKYLEVVVFDPRQIKSATGNVGTWSPEEEDITLEEDDSL